MSMFFINCSLEQEYTFINNLKSYFQQMKGSVVITKQKELQIRGRIEDNPKINFLISHKKHML